MKTVNATPPQKRRRSRGFTLVEVVIALAILAIAFFGMVSVITYTNRMNLNTKQRLLAMRAVEKKIEQMLATASFNDIYLMFSKQGTGDKGYGWDLVPDLDEKRAFIIDDPNQLKMPTGYTYPKLSFPTNLVVRFPLNSSGSGFSEVGSGEFLGNAVYNVANTPSSGLKEWRNIDLNSDGDNTDTDIQLTDIRVLPVLVEVHWIGVAGPKTGTRGHPFVQYRYTFFRPE